jgi:hypothetical protein
MLTRSLAELDTAFLQSKGYPVKVGLAGEMLRTPELNENRKWLEKHLLDMHVFKDQAKDFALMAGVPPETAEALAVGAPKAPDLKEAKRAARSAKKAAKLAAKDVEREVAAGEDWREALVASSRADAASHVAASVVATKEHQARKVARKTAVVSDPVSAIVDLPALVREVMVREAKGNGYEADGKDCDSQGQRNLKQAQDQYLSAGLTLIKIKTAVAGTEKAFLKVLFTNGCELQRTRVLELISIGSGKKTVDGLRAETAERVAAHRARKASVTKEDVTDAKLFAKAWKLILVMSPPQQRRTLSKLTKLLADTKSVAEQRATEALEQPGASP